MIWMYGMSADVQSRLAAAVSNPQADSSLYQHLWNPLRAQTQTSALDNRSVILYMDPFQDIPQIISSLRSDPVITSLSIQSIEENSFACFGTSPPPSFQRVTEYYNAILHHYFLSSSGEGNAAIDSGAAGPGWARTGESFLTIPPSPCYQSRPVFRFYHPIANTHFYTTDTQECGGLRQPKLGWIAEGVAFGAALPVAGQCPDARYTPVYRLYNDRWMYNDSNHRYTVNPAIYAEMTAKGWVGEGVALCVRNGR